MAKTEVVKEQKKEVGFGELELKIAKPKLDENKSMIVSGNFTELAESITSLVEKYKGTQLTDSNFNYVKTLKGQFTTLRTGIERERKEWKKIYIQPASKMIDAMCDDLQKIVAEGETALASQLDAYDQRRKDELTVILTEYVEDSASKHNLRPEFANQIQLKKEYYNKTQDEEDSADDIELQAAELEKKQIEYDSSIDLIKAECEDSGLLADTYIRELNYKSAMEIILEIKNDKKILEQTKKEQEDKEVLTLGEEVKVSLPSFDEDKVELRERTLWIQYEPSKGKLIQQFLKDNGINYKFL